MKKPIIIGRVGNTFGIKGWSHLISYTDPQENIFTYKNWRIEQSPNHYIPITLESYKEHGNHFVIKFADVKDCDQALLLKGKSIAVERAELPVLSQNNYYWSDLIGLSVVNTKGESLGIIDHLFETGSNDVIVTKITTKIDEKHTGEKNIFIPYLGSVVKTVDLEKQMMVVEWEP
jgi:16S rRNA processing protein RimM